MIFGRKRSPLSGEMREWIAEALIWCAEAGVLRADAPVVVPTAQFITAPGGQAPEATARALLDDVLRLADMANAQIDMLPIEVLPDELRHSYGQLSEVAGTWQSDGNSALIRYDPTLIRRPSTFLSMLAHEVMHERLSHTAGDWPGGEETEEPMTDLAAIAAGFGVLQLAGAEDAGWQGYLRQDTRAHALALVLRACDRDEAEALSHLPARAAKGLRRALSVLEREPTEVEALKSALAVTKP